MENGKLIEILEKYISFFLNQNFSNNKKHITCVYNSSY